ncbi:hypothetical protein GGP41_004466 [Bipolaris sorokiniana]|uniref:Uncharacterized protein n=2 Tax=Cochliobolus sativus TaxID=45130 RepID=A0A8H5ZJ86_COCSA|nr:uncharacterized protein COCSADRAFT_164399 [Bipolaris sorokiniana ND90Pr]EMD59492.1 hypothetical protein COCSADRAFT_164399 [Bipolaris sorokiniana ND90Pr]KAF5851573.1 hypothetical protein GGP41_004466 [Bipolaris sorokiniana]
MNAATPAKKFEHVPVFGNITPASSNSDKFATNLLKISRYIIYGHDGVHLGWQYPGAPGR